MKHSCAYSRVNGDDLSFVTESSASAFFFAFSFRRQLTSYAVVRVVHLPSCIRAIRRLQSSGLSRADPSSLN
jgi:hypothetical protein